MNIGFIAHNFVRGNGQGRINYEIVRRLSALGHQVTLFADAVAPELQTQGVMWQRVRQIPNKPNLLGVYVFANAADRALSRCKERFDIVLGAGFTLRGRHDINLCQFVHGAWMKSPVHTSKLRGGLYGKYQQLYSHQNSVWERQAFAAAQVVVAPSEKIRLELESVGVPASKIEVIYNGVDTDEFSPGTADRAALKLPADKTLALFVGDIRTPRKNLDSVLRGLVEVPELHLAIVGELDRSPFPDMAKALGIADRTHFVGYSNNVTQYMRASDMFVFPSRYEAGTLVLMEAAASGLPIITAKTAGGCEIFGTDAAEVIDDPDDIEALVSAIRRFVASQQDRAVAAIAARRVALDYSWTKMADRYLELFQSQARLQSSPQLVDLRSN